MCGTQIWGEMEPEPHIAFGQLMRLYRRTGGKRLPGPLSREDLAKRMEWWSASSIEKYERGERKPPANFIAHFVLYLGLTDDQEWALISSLAADELVAYWEEYKREKARFYSGHAGSRKLNPD